MVDFRKAFDLVDHELLLEKLSNYKCSETFISLMKVVSMSGKSEINCGVP